MIIMVVIEINGVLMVSRPLVERSKFVVLMAKRVGGAY